MSEQSENQRDISQPSEPRNSALRLQIDGYTMIERPGLCPNLLQRAAVRALEISQGCEVRVAEGCRAWHIGDTKRIQKLDNPHLVEPTLRDLCTSAALVRAVVDATGSTYLQIWATQLVIKPHGGRQLGEIGWHRDEQYWQCWAGDVFTVWIALTDVGEASGPVVFVKGSHRWPLQSPTGDAYQQDWRGVAASLAAQSPGPWVEHAARLPRGGLSIHHKRILHASGPNDGAGPRIGLVVNFRTQHSCAVPGVPDFGMLRCLSEVRDFPVVHDPQARSPKGGLRA